MKARTRAGFEKYEVGELMLRRGWHVNFVHDDFARRRWSIASRVLAAILGGYVATSLLTLAIPLTLGRFGFSQAQVLLAVTTASFLIYAAIIMAVFSAQSAKHAWAILFAASMSATALIFLLLPTVCP